MTPKLESVRSELLALAKSESLQFVFSGVHLSEMAPLEAKYAPAAAARADLLVELCARNAFISFDRVVEAEIACLLPSEVCAAQILSQNGGNAAKRTQQLRAASAISTSVARGTTQISSYAR